MSNKLTAFHESRSANDRARIQLMTSLIAEIAGFNPHHISITPGVKPNAYNGEGSPYGWYYRQWLNGGLNSLVVQPVIWIEQENKWEDFAEPIITLNALESYIDSLNEQLSEFEQTISESLSEEIIQFKQDIGAEKLVSSDTTDGGESTVTSLPGIKNLIRLSEGEYAALDGSSRLKPDTMYVIMEA